MNTWTSIFYTHSPPLAFQAVCAPLTTYDLCAVDKYCFDCGTSLGDITSEPLGFYGTGPLDCAQACLENNPDNKYFDITKEGNASPQVRIRRSCLASGCRRRAIVNRQLSIVKRDPPYPSFVTPHTAQSVGAALPKAAMFPTLIMTHTRSTGCVVVSATGLGVSP